MSICLSSLDIVSSASFPLYSINGTKMEYMLFIDMIWRQSYITCHVLLYLSILIQNVFIDVEIRLMVHGHNPLSVFWWSYSWPNKFHTQKIDQTQMFIKPTALQLAVYCSISFTFLNIYSIFLIINTSLNVNFF